MRLDLKIQGKSLIAMKWQGIFHFTKNGLFQNFCKDIIHIFPQLHSVYSGVSGIPTTYKIAVLFDVS